MENYEAHCADLSCVTKALNEEHALHQGWLVLDGQLWCPVHGTYRAFVARREERKEKIRQQIDRQRMHRNEIVAKKQFSAAEYRAWDEFQSDLADYHKKTGKLAPEVLRTMTPVAWHNEYAQKGRIDVEATAANFEETKVARGKRTISILKGV